MTQQSAQAVQVKAILKFLVRECVPARMRINPHHRPDPNSTSSLLQNKAVPSSVIALPYSIMSQNSPSFIGCMYSNYVASG